MSDLSKIKIALCQVEAVQGHPSVFEQSTRQLAGYARSTGANLVVCPGETPQLVGMNGGIVAQEGDRATLALGEDLYRIALGAPAEDCDFAVISAIKDIRILKCMQPGICCPGNGSTILYWNAMILLLRSAIRYSTAKFLF